MTNGCRLLPRCLSKWAVIGLLFIAPWSEWGICLSWSVRRRCASWRQQSRYKKHSTDQVITFNQMLILECHVVRRAVGEKGFFLVRESSDLLHGAANIKKPAFQMLARWHQAARANNHFVLDHGTVHHDATHADQDPAADRAAVQ